MIYIPFSVLRLGVLPWCILQVLGPFDQALTLIWTHFLATMVVALSCIPMEQRKHDKLMARDDHGLTVMDIMVSDRLKTTNLFVFP